MSTQQGRRFSSRTQSAFLDVSSILRTSPCQPTLGTSQEKLKTSSHSNLVFDLPVSALMIFADFSFGDNPRAWGLKKVSSIVERNILYPSNLVASTAVIPLLSQIFWSSASHGNLASSFWYYV